MTKDILCMYNKYKRKWYFMATVNTSIKIDEETKKEAQKLFKDLGLN